MTGPGCGNRRQARVAKVLLVVGAAGDATENACLLLAIQQPESEFWPPVTAIATLVKFTGLLVGAAALLVVRAARRHPLHPEDRHH